MLMFPEEQSDNSNVPRNIEGRLLIKQTVREDAKSVYDITVVYQYTNV